MLNTSKTVYDRQAARIQTQITNASSSAVAIVRYTVEAAGFVGEVVAENIVDITNLAVSKLREKILGNAAEPVLPPEVQPEEEESFVMVYKEEAVSANSLKEHIAQQGLESLWALSDSQDQRTLDWMNKNRRNPNYDPLIGLTHSRSSIAIL